MKAPKTRFYPRAPSPAKWAQGLPVRAVRPWARRRARTPGVACRPCMQYLKLPHKTLAAGSGVTPAYLGHMFKKETGIFFNDYLLHCRLERSVILMRNPNRKIKDIAETVGFTSTSYFVKCFREYKGVSPAKYRVIWAEMGGAP